MRYDMTAIKKTILLFTALSLSLLSGQMKADGIKIAVASNFIHPMKALARQFEENTGQKITLITGSTGKHYAQISNGAPYDVFFAADSQTPELLEKEKKTIINTRFTYAIGKIVLWSPNKMPVPVDRNFLQQAKFRYLAIANPKLAPYGRAAQQVLSKLDLWDKLKGQLVRGENIGQAFQFVKTGHAEVGFVAFSQLKRLSGDTSPGSVWDIPQDYYHPIIQQAILINDKKAAKNFLLFCQSTTGLKIINEYGYMTP